MKVVKISNCGGKKCGSSWAGATKLITAVKINSEIKKAA